MRLDVVSLTMIRFTSSAAFCVAALLLGLTTASAESWRLDRLCLGKECPRLQCVGSARYDQYRVNAKTRERVLLATYARQSECLNTTPWYEPGQNIYIGCFPVDEKIVDGK